MASDMPSLLQQSIMVVFVFMGLGLCVWALRRKGFAQLSLGHRLSRRHNLLQVVERLPLTAQHSLHLVRIEDRVLVVGVSPSAVNILESLSPATAQQLASSHQNSQHDGARIK